jgi:hypothetical protein
LKGGQKDFLNRNRKIKILLEFITNWWNFITKDHLSNDCDWSLMGRYSHWLNR